MAFEEEEVGSVILSLLCGCFWQGVFGNSPRFYRGETDVPIFFFNARPGLTKRSKDRPWLTKRSKTLGRGPFPF